MCSKKNICVVLIGLVATIFAQSSFADDVVFSSQAVQGKPMATLLVEERPDGQPGALALSPGTPQSVKLQAETSGNGPQMIALTGGVFLGMTLGSPTHEYEGSLPPIVPLVGGRLGLKLFDHVLELGVDGGFNLGFSYGGYVHLSPIPGDKGLRVYLYGRLFRAYGLKDSTSSGGSVTVDLGDAHGSDWRHVDLYEFGLGVRQDDGSQKVVKQIFGEVGGGSFLSRNCTFSDVPCARDGVNTIVMSLRLGANF